MKTVYMCDEYLCILTLLISGTLVLDLYKQPQGVCLFVCFGALLANNWSYLKLMGEFALDSEWALPRVK